MLYIRINIINARCTVMYCMQTQSPTVTCQLLYPCLDSVLLFYILLLLFWPFRDTWYMLRYDQLLRWWYARLFLPFYHALCIIFNLVTLMFLREVLMAASTEMFRRWQSGYASVYMHSAGEAVVQATHHIYTVLYLTDMHCPLLAPVYFAHNTIHTSG